MVAVIEEFDGNMVRLLDYETQEAMTIPKAYLPNNRKIGVGSYIKLSCIQIQEPAVRHEDVDSGGFIKNKPKMNLV